MFKSPVDSINAKKEKAFGIFIKARNDLLAVIEEAVDHRIKNRVEHDALISKMHQLNVDHSDLWDHIEGMKKSVEQIESIIVVK